MPRRVESSQEPASAVAYDFTRIISASLYIFHRKPISIIDLKCYHCRQCLADSLVALRISTVQNFRVISACAYLRDFPKTELDNEINAPLL